jgi:hypothetical protein
MTQFLCIACEIFARPIYLSAAYSPHVIDIQLIERGLHNSPDKLRSCIQQYIDQAEGRGYEGILLAYGLCGNSTVGIIARSIPLVLPRVHDCIAFLLGSRKRYDSEFDKYPGTYWYTQDFIERQSESGGFNSMGPVTDDDISKLYTEYKNKFGEENAQYLMEVFGSWQTHYQRAAFIDTGLSSNIDRENEISNDAQKRGWLFETLPGDLVLFQQLLKGDWNDQDFVVIPPKNTLNASFDNDIFRKCDCE